LVSLILIACSSCAAPAAVYNLVLKLQQHALAKIKPGVAWADVQQSTRHLLLQQLLQLGLVKGSLDALTEAGVDRVFMPHGLGHFLGLDVHDVSAAA
jgi:Xaa-Pro dipeptidase